MNRHAANKGYEVFLSYANLFASSATAAACLIHSSGCGSAPVKLDHELARRSLTKALDTWKAGGDAEDLRQQSPEIVVGDPDWSKGHRLVDYRVAGEGTRGTNSLRLPVKIALKQSPNGNVRKLDVIYIVGVEPVITVIREPE